MTKLTAMEQIKKSVETSKAKSITKRWREENNNFKFTIVGGMFNFIKCLLYLFICLIFNLISALMHFHFIYCENHIFQVSFFFFEYMYSISFEHINTFHLNEMMKHKQIFIKYKMAFVVCILTK